MGFVSQESQQHVDENATTCTSSVDDNENNNEQQPAFHHDDNFINLDMHIKTLFLLNGLVQVIPNLALMALINDRIKLPAEYIPAYYAINFLPYSLKPLYGIITYWITELSCKKCQYQHQQHHQHHQSGLNTHINEQEEEWIDNDRSAHSSSISWRNMVIIQRHHLLIFLQLCASLSFILTATLQQNQIIQCFIMGFIRSFTISWAEFLLGLALIASVKSKTLIDYVVENHNHTNATMVKWKRNHEEKLLSMHQSQAATSRNVGSLIGQIIMFSVILIHKYYVHKDDGDDILNSFFIMCMILATAVIPLIAAFIAYKGRVGTSFESNRIRNTSSIWRRSNQGRNSYDMISSEDPSIPNTSNSQCPNHPIFRIKRISLYLILRHAMPSTSGIVGSFEYTVFRSNPLYLQCMALIASLCAVLASSFYGRYISKRFANIKDIASIIVVTTILSSVWSLLFLPFYHEFRGEEGIDNMDDDINDSIIYQGSLTLFITFTLFQVVQSFLEEISFLPSVVIATNAVMNTDVTNLTIMRTGGILPQSLSNEETHDASVDYRMEQANIYQSWYLNDGILYGFMISCIDLGDQIGDWISGPIVKALHIQRENNWDNLNIFIIISSVAAILSLVFLRLLWYSSKPIDR